MKKLLFFCFNLSLFLALNLYAQDDISLNFNQSLLAPSPDALMLIRNVNVAVDKNTGIANVDIPIHTIKTGEHECNISVSYHTGGIKITDIASTVGLGWKLNAGGSITRIVRGTADVYAHHKQAGDLGSWNGDKAWERMTEGFDGEPDLFYYEIPGNSGMFVHNNDGIPYTIPYSNVVINRLEASTSYEIIDAEGNRYIFSTAERSFYKTEPENKVQNYISSWLLDKVEYYDGRFVHFNYTSGPQYFFDMPNATIGKELNIIGTELGIKNTDKTAHISINPKYLTEIVTNNDRIRFYYSFDRRDVSNYAKLNEIEIWGDGEIIKTYNLDYTYFDHLRLRLDVVNEISPKGNKLPVASFEYNTNIQLPERTSNNFDHGGYYNSNEPNVPNYALNELYPDGAERIPNIIYAKANSLQKITFRTGGTKRFIYELHKGKNKKGLIVNAYGLRIAKIIETASDQAQDIETSYEYEGEIFDEPGYEYQSITRKIYSSGGRLWTFNDSEISSRTCNQIFDLSGVPVVYSKVIEIRPNGSRYEYKYYGLTEYPDINAKDYQITKEGINESQIENRAWTPSTSYSWCRNLIKSISSYDSNGRLYKDTKYAYNLNSTNIKAIIPAYAFQYKVYNNFAVDYGSIRTGVTYNYALSHYDWISQPVIVDSVVVEKGKYNFREVTKYKHDPDKLVPIEITRKLGDDEYKTLLRYPFQYNITSVGTSSSLYPYKTLSDNNVLKPIETAAFKNDILLNAEFVEFKGEFIGNNFIWKYTALPYKYYSVRSPKEISYSEFKPSIVQNGAVIKDPHYKLLQTNQIFDNHGNATTTISLGKIKSKIYGYSGDKLIAEAEDVIYSPVKKQLQETITEYNYNSEIYSTIQPITLQIPTDQRLWVEMKYDMDIYPSGDGYVNVIISSSLDKFGDIYSSQEHVCNDFTFGVDIKQGTYYFEVIDPSTTDNRRPFSLADGKANLKFKILTPHPAGFDSQNQFYYTSFEEDITGDNITIITDKAKTGRKVKKGPITLELNNFLPGRYKISYWRSTNEGFAWYENYRVVTFSNPNEVYTITDEGWIDEVRVTPYLEEIPVTSYTYRPGIGITSITDQNKSVTYWEYDDFCRPFRMMDYNRNTVKEYKYNLKNQ